MIITYFNYILYNNYLLLLLNFYSTTDRKIPGSCNHVCQRFECLPVPLYPVAIFGSGLCIPLDVLVCQWCHV